MKPEVLEQMYIELTPRLPFAWMVSFSDEVLSVYSGDVKLEILMHDESGRYLKRTVECPYFGVARLIHLVRGQMDEMILKLFNHEGATKQ